MFLRSCWSSGYKTGVSMTWKLSKNTHPARILFCPYIYLVPLEKTKKNMLPLLPPSKPHTTPATVEECSDQNTSPAPPQETEAKIFTTISVFRSICCGKDSASQQTECTFLVSYQVKQIYREVRDPLNKMRCNACWQELMVVLSQLLVVTSSALKMPARYLAMMPHAQSVIKCCLRGCCLAMLYSPFSWFRSVILSFVTICDAMNLHNWKHIMFFSEKMATAGLSPQMCILCTVMKSTYKSVMFYIGQKELEMQFKMNRIVGQCRQKCEALQEKCTEKLEQIHNAYQKMAKRCHMMEQEIESLNNDKQELQEKFSEQSRQKRKLEEMYDQLRSENESMKRSAIQPVTNFYARRNDADLFADTGATMMDSREQIRNDKYTSFWKMRPRPREDIWTTRQESANSGFGSSPVRRQGQAELGNRRAGGNPAFGAATGNPSMTLKNLIFSPIKRPPQTRSRNNLFTL
ncbi:E3 ubiquitin-protein ligase CCNB1IP1 homolog [Linum perenne]